MEISGADRSCRTGEITRGMVVVDRRLDKGAYASGANRAKVEDSRLEARSCSSIGREGVACIIGTPGPDVLLNLLLERVWGN